MDLKVSENGEEEAMDDEQKKNFNGEQESTRLKRNDGITNNEIKKSEKIKIQSVSLDNFFYCKSHQRPFVEFYPSEGHSIRKQSTISLSKQRPTYHG